MKPALTLEEFEPGKFAPKTGWLKEIWDKWPGDEPFEKLLEMLKGDSEKTNPTGEKQKRPRSGTRKR